MAEKQRGPYGVPERVTDSPWRAKLHEVIFEAETPAGKAFDVALLWAIVLSVLAVSFESVAAVRADYGVTLRVLEWVFTILFTVEYVLRLAAVRRPLRYATSFYGIVDVLAIVPTYVSVFFPGSQSLIVVRALRLLRIFRILKLAHFMGEARMLQAAVRGSVRKIVVFLGFVVTIMLIAGAAMYLVEGDEGGFTSIPRSVYWAVVTMTTVGYGDIAPQTVLGQMLASVLMIMGYGIIAVPTGIMTVEISAAIKKAVRTRSLSLVRARRARQRRGLLQVLRHGPRAKQEDTLTARGRFARAALIAELPPARSCYDVGFRRRCRLSGPDLMHPTIATRSSRPRGCAGSSRIAASLCLALIAAGCRAPRAYFRPAERTVVETDDRVPGAQFELRDEQGRVGELRAWCVHAEVDVDPEDKRRRFTYVDIGLELENISKEDLLLVVGEARLRDIHVEGERIESVAPFEPGESVRVAPNSVMTKYLAFELPGDVRPRDIGKFRLQWVVSGAGERRFTDLTTFVRGRRRSHRRGPNWGWGFAIGFPLWHLRRHH